MVPTSLARSATSTKHPYDARGNFVRLVVRHFPYRGTERIFATQQRPFTGQRATESAELAVGLRRRARVEAQHSAKPMVAPDRPGKRVGDGGTLVVTQWQRGNCGRHCS